MSSLTARLAVAFAVVVALAGLMFGAAGYVTTQRQVNGQVDAFLQDRATDIVGGRRSRPQNQQQGNTFRDRSTGGRRGASEGGDRSVDADSIAQILNGDGSISITTDLELPIADADRDIAQGRKQTSILRTVEIDGDELRMITAPLPDGGAIQVARRLTESRSLVSALRSGLLVTILAASIVAGLLGALLARRITAPIRSLAATVGDVAATKDFSTPIEVTGTDEVGRLAAGFDDLLNSLAESEQQQSQLVQDVAHELRTPLTSIRANVDLLSIATDLPPEERSQMMESLKLELRELTLLVNEIVTVAAKGQSADRAAAAHQVETDLAELAGDAVERFQLRTGRTVVASLTPTSILGDREGLIRAVSNLLSNAEKYSPDGTMITVDVPGDGWLHVADRGSGIAAEDRDRVFDRFYRSDEARAQPGSGLGLSIVTSIIDEHGGQVRLDDHADGGTVASLFVPPR